MLHRDVVQRFTRCSGEPSCLVPHSTMTFRMGIFCVVWAALAVPCQGASPGAQASAAASPDGCSLPPIDPNGDFLSNFNNSCYAIPMVTSHGQNFDGDLNGTYYTIWYQLRAGYELVVTGAFPNSRFFAATVYDAHSAVTGSLLDNQILPLTSSMTNPYIPGSTYQPGQQYALTVGFGGGPPLSVDPGCSTPGTTDQNFIDASQIHKGITWTGYPNLPPGFPPHQTGANTAGAIIVRAYVNTSTQPPPGVIVRQLSNGCALPAAQAISQSILTTTPSIGNSWANYIQVAAHQEFAYSIEPLECYAPDLGNSARWVRSPDYIPGIDAYAGYLEYTLNSSFVSSLISGQQFIRIQFKMPTFPNIPCSTGTCTLTGIEQVRYRSISFESGKTTLASIKDSDIVLNPNGYATLIIGMGTAPPAYVTSSNYYTYFNFAAVANYQNVTSVVLRDILPNAAFNCSVMNVPNFTSEYNAEGGFMGNFVPTVDYPTASQITNKPHPLYRMNTCSIVPTETPTQCPATN